MGNVCSNFELKGNLQKGVAFGLAGILGVTGVSVALADKPNCEDIDLKVNYGISDEYLSILKKVINQKIGEDISDEEYLWANYVLGKFMKESQLNAGARIKNWEEVHGSDIYDLAQYSNDPVTQSVLQEMRERLAGLYNIAFKNEKHTDYEKITDGLNATMDFMDTNEGLLPKGGIWTLTSSTVRVLSEISTLVVETMDDHDQAIVFTVFDYDKYLVKGTLEPRTEITDDEIKTLKLEGCKCPIKGFIAAVLEIKRRAETVNQRLGIGACDASGFAIIDDNEIRVIGNSNTDRVLLAQKLDGEYAVVNRRRA